MKKVLGCFTIFITIICMKFYFNYNVKASTNSNNKVKFIYFMVMVVHIVKKKKNYLNDLRKKNMVIVFEFIYYEVWNNEEKC